MVRRDDRLRVPSRTTPTRSRVVLALSCSLLGVAAALAGCPSNDCNPGFEPENILPETTLSTEWQGTPAPGSRLRLNWFGWDPDGEIVGYDIRSALDDTMGAWSTVVSTDSVFFMPDVDSWSFMVRAIDNEGGVDATPESVGYVFRE
jgi:hypothetical protein